MGSGKTTLSKVLYKELVKENPDIKLIDTDAYIEEKLSRKISDIFANEGEAYFRDIETETLRELADANRHRILRRRYSRKKRESADT